jgi:hypothetical protein
VQEPKEFIPAHNPSVVRVIFTDHSTMSLTHPRVSGDSLLGLRQTTGEPVGVPLSRVDRIQVVRRDGKKTTLIVAGLGAVAVAGMIAALRGNGTGGAMCDMGDSMMGEIC